MVAMEPGSPVATLHARCLAVTVLFEHANIAPPPHSACLIALEGNRRVVEHLFHLLPKRQKRDPTHSRSPLLVRITDRVYEL